MKQRTTHAAVIPATPNAPLIGSRFSISEQRPSLIKEDLACKVLIKSNHRCVATGCMQWIRDPAADCPKDVCDEKEHPCNIYNNYPHCSPEWVEVVDKWAKAQTTWWVVWRLLTIQTIDVSPAIVLNTSQTPKSSVWTVTQRRAHATSMATTPNAHRSGLNLLMRKQSPWQREYSDVASADDINCSCIASNCTQYSVPDPNSVCPGPVSECDRKDHPCNTYSSYPQCSADWNAVLDKWEDPEETKYMASANESKW